MQQVSNFLTSQTTISFTINILCHEVDAEAITEIVYLLPSTQATAKGIKCIQ
jgi:hypothetical protein